MAINVENVGKFKFYAQKVMPLVYDESLSYYEFLCKVMKKLNEVIDSVDNQNEILQGFDTEIETFETTTDGKYEQFVANVNELIDAFEQGEIEARETFEGQMEERADEFEDTINGEWEDFFETYLQTLGVVQIYGNSTTDVMSQNATTLACNAKQAQIDEIHKVIFNETTNIFDASAQTSETIVAKVIKTDGSEASSTTYNSTDYFRLNENTKYTCVILPNYGSISFPWGGVIFEDCCGIAFYDSNKNFIGYDTTNTFTTPIGTVYARFNYKVSAGITLTIVKSRTVIVVGETVPTEYTAFVGGNISDIIKYQKAVKIYYNVSNDETNSVKVKTHYNATKDLVIHLNKHGGNNIFDFYQVYFVAKDNDILSSKISPITEYILTTSGDWHAPYIVAAVNDIDGDLPNSHHFTGGNHNYNNTGSGDYTATGRTANLKVYANNVPITNGDGFCNNLRIEWDNYIQGYNTKKENGTGREILREHICMNFDGNKWESETKIYPLEDITIERWYGLQALKATYDYVIYIGGATREICSLSTTSNSDSLETNGIMDYNDNDSLTLLVDKEYDLGSREYNLGTYAFNIASSGKCYANIIRESGTTYTANFDGGTCYAMRGSYEWKPV